MSHSNSTRRDLEGLADLNLAAFLATREVHPTEVRPQPYSRLVSFLYERDERFLQALAEWQKGPPVAVDLNRFMQTRRLLLEAARSAKGEAGR